jgi:hypothetical protein
MIAEGPSPQSLVLGSSRQQVRRYSWKLETVSRNLFATEFSPNKNAEHDVKIHLPFLPSCVFLQLTTGKGETWWRTTGNRRA